MKRIPTQYTRGFTLIELLIVVAITSILAAIAVVHMSEASVRAKVSRVVSDMRSLSTGLEAYRVDERGYPPALASGVGYNAWYTEIERLKPLTTPTAYLTTVASDVFARPEDLRSGQYGYWDYSEKKSVDMFYTRGGSPPQVMLWDSMGNKAGSIWRLASRGPDLSSNWESVLAPDLAYDPTNGTVSAGDVLRWGM